MFESDDVLYCAMPLFHGNALNANLFPALRSGRDDRAAPQVLGVGVPPRRAALRRDVLQHRRPRARSHPRRRPRPRDDRNHSIKYVLGPETAPADVRAFRKRFGVPVIEGYGSSENAIILIPDPTLPKGSLGRPLDGIDVVDPRSGDRGGEAARALRRARQAAERGRSDRRARQPHRDVALRGLLQQPGGRRRAHAQRLVLVRRSRLPRRSRRVLVRRPQRRLDPRRRRELRGGADRTHPRPVPRRRRRRGVRRARQPDRRPGDGRDRAAARRDVRPGRVRDLPRRAARPRHQVGAALRAHRRRAAGRRDRTRSTSARCAPNGGRPPTRCSGAHRAPTRTSRSPRRMPPRCAPSSKRTSARTCLQ